MPRPYKSADARRAEILEAAVGLFVERGYENTSVQAILDAVGISKGAFYHHFRSKEALLDALTEQLRAAALLVAQPALEAPGLTGPERLLALFRAINAWKLEQRPLMLDLGRALFDEANLPLLARHQRATRAAMTPLLAELIAQGAREGRFDVVAPLPAAEILWALFTTLGEAFSTTLFDPAATPEALAGLELRRAATQQAIERALGAAEGSLPVIGPEALRPWLEPSSSPQQRSPR